MSRIRYKPRFKKALQGTKLFFSFTKELKNLKKQKWLPLLKDQKNTNLFVRNDVHVVQGRTFDMRKNYKQATLSKQRASACFSTFRGKAFRKIFDNNYQKRNPFPGASIDCAVDKIELRLDTVLVSANLAKTLYHARWLIVSGFVFLNKNCIHIPSFQLSLGDFVLVKVVREKKLLFNPQTFTLPPHYLEVNFGTLSTILVDNPSTRGSKKTRKMYSFFFDLEDIVNFNKVN
jgi:ribosomal protein S4